MKPVAPFAVALLLALACDPSAEDIASPVQQAVHDRTIRIGVLIDDASPAKANFTAAATLAERQINEGLTAAHSDFAVDVIVGYYGGTTGKTQATRTIDLVERRPGRRRGQRRQRRARAGPAAPSPSTA